MVVGFKLQQKFIEKQQDDEEREEQSSNYSQFSYILRIHVISVHCLSLSFLLIWLSKILPH